MNKNVRHITICEKCKKHVQNAKNEKISFLHKIRASVIRITNIVQARLILLS